MEMVRFSETSAWLHGVMSQKISTLDGHRCENLKPDCGFSWVQHAVPGNCLQTGHDRLVLFVFQPTTQRSVV
jgi:hypothetical protein